MELLAIVTARRFQAVGYLFYEWLIALSLIFRLAKGTNKY